MKNTIGFLVVLIFTLAIVADGYIHAMDSRSISYSKIERDLGEAVLDNDKAKVESLLQDANNSKYINHTKYPNGKTLLHYAVDIDSPEIINLLIDKGAMIDQIIENGATPLFISVFRNKIHAMHALLSKGANVNAEMSIKINENIVTNFTPLMAASLFGRQNIVSILKKHGASIGKKSSNELRAIDFAVSKGHLGIAKLLLPNYY